MFDVVEPVIKIAAAAVQTSTSVPASKVGAALQVISLVTVGLAPKHAPEPVTVNVLVNEPDAVVGVNTH